MDVKRIEPPRAFPVGVGEIEIRHCADLALEPDEQVTFVTASGTELDVVRKSWGYYATSSLNGRLPSKGLRAALVLSTFGGQRKLFLLLVERGCEREFERYLADQSMSVLAWLDDDEAVAGAIEKLRS